MGTENSAALKVDSKPTKIIEASVYDTNPVHYISMVSEELEWVVKEEKYFNVDMGKVIN